MIYLVASLIALAVGPLLFVSLGKERRWLAVLDGFNFVAIGGLIFFGILPETARLGGGWVLLFALVGIVGPTLMERQSHRFGRDSHILALVLGMLGLCVHAVFDGAALIEGTGAVEAAAATAPGTGDVHEHFHGERHLPFAVVLHRVPIGLTIWLLLRPRYGVAMALAVAGLVAASTVAGFALGTSFLTGLPPAGLACFEALVAGSLIHVVLHKTTPAAPRPEGAAIASPAPHWEGLGGLAGVALLGVLIGGSALILETELGREIAHTFVDLSLESAPALLLGYALAGLLSVLLPEASIRWLRRGPRPVQALRGMAIGLPLPVCSCGVVPLYRTLVERGAPPAAAMAFMVATPELGIDAVLLSLPLLGVEMTAVRVAAAAIIAFLVGWLVSRIPSETPLEVTGESASPQGSLGTRVRHGLRYSFGELVDHTAPWILLGLALAALVGPLVDPAWFGALPPVIAVVAFALLGIPTYVCASGATPLVAMLLARGVSPGAGLAFLLTGPATNMTTFGVLGRLHGKRAAIVFSLTILGLSVALGLVTDLILTDYSPPAFRDEHEHGGAVWRWIALGALALVYASSFLRRGPRRFVKEVFDTGSSLAAPPDANTAAPSDRDDCCH